MKAVVVALAIFLIGRLGRSHGNGVVGEWGDRAVVVENNFVYYRDRRLLEGINLSSTVRLYVGTATQCQTEVLILMLS